MMLSPDTEDLLRALNTLNNGASLVPEDLDAAVSHVISRMGTDAIMMCSGKSPEAKRWFVLGAAYQATR